MTKKLLVRPIPEPGEALSGYIMRLANTNLIGVHQLMCELNSYYSNVKSPYLGYRFDMYGGEVIDLKRLSEWTNVPIQVLEGMTFSHTWRKLRVNPLESNSASRFISSSIIKTHRRFCALCLKNDGVYQLMWQLEDIQICNKHLVKLQSECKICSTSQPYISDFGKYHMCVNGCSYLSTLDSHPIIENKIIQDQELKYSEWEFLLDPTTDLINPIEGMTHLQSLIIVLLYLAQRNKGVDQHCIWKIIPGYYINSVREHTLESAFNPVVTMKRILQITRNASIQIWDFHKISIPNEFVKSVINTSQSVYHCQAPWCSCYLTESKMVRVTNRYQFSSEGITYNLHSICLECGIEYGIDKNDGVWKPIGNFIELSMKARDLTVQGFSRKSIAFKLGIPQLRSYNIVGYLAYHDLLPSELGKKFMPEWEVPDDVVGKFQVVGKGLYAGKAKVLFGWTQTEYSYLLNHPAVREYIVCELKTKNHYYSSGRFKPKPMKNEMEMIMKIKNAIDDLVKEDMDVTQKNIEQITGLPVGFIYRNGFASLVKSYAREQNKARMNKYEDHLITLANNYISEVKRQNRIIRLRDVWISIGVNAQTVSERFPRLVRLVKAQING